MSKLFKNLNKKELSWVLYDVGNSAYTLLACALIPIWYKSLAIGNGSGQISSDKATAYYSLAISIMTVISAFIGPICGTIADRRGMKKIIFIVLMFFVCCIPVSAEEYNTDELYAASGAGNLSAGDVLDEYGISFENPESILSLTPSKIWSIVKDIAESNISAPLKLFSSLFIVIILEAIGSWILCFTNSK